VTEHTSLPNQLLCPYCKRLITLPSIKLGAKEKCPHCELEFVVSHRQIPDKGSFDASEEGEEYALQSYVPAAHPQNDLLSDANARGEEEDLEEELEEEKATWQPLQAPPPGLFLFGTFSFPFFRALVVFIILVVMSFTVFALAEGALFFGSYPQVGESAGPWVTSLLLALMAFAAGIISLLTFSAFGLAILRDTSEGLDKFASWPRGLFTEWFEDALYVLINLFFGSLPALALLWALPDSATVKFSVQLFSESIFFPVFLLSALDAGSVAMPYSKAVWQSIGRAWQAWILYYLFALLTGESFVLLLRWTPSENIWIDALKVSVLFSYFWIVYFRLMGRLALYCSGFYDILHPPKRIVEEELPEEAE
jgi:hypothetical protein